MVYARHRRHLRRDPRHGDNLLEFIAAQDARLSITAVKASGVLTASAIANADTVTVGPRTYTFQDTLTNVDGNVKRSGAKASGTLTASALANGDTVTIDGRVYTFEDTLTDVNGHVKRSGVLATDLANLVKAINLTGVAGTDYAASQTIHATVSATSGATTLVATAKAIGTAGNALATTETSATAAWGAATLSGGLANVLATDLANLAKAINLTGVAGTDYAAAQTVHATVSATSNATTLTATAKSFGAAGNSIATTETSGTAAWGAATLAGGVTGVTFDTKAKLQKYTAEEITRATLASQLP